MERLIEVVLMLSLAASALLMRHRFADAVFNYYNSKPYGTFGPRWWRWQFHPSRRQSYWVVYIFALIFSMSALWSLFGCLTETKSELAGLC